MLSNERQTYLIALNEAKMRLPLHVKKPIFRDLYTKVSPFALKQMLPHYLKVINHEMKPYTKYFTTVMVLPYAHIMERRMSEAAGVLKIEDIHPHWLLEKLIPQRDEASESESAGRDNDDTDAIVDPAAIELLHVNNPAIIKPRGRPTGARNKPKKKRTRMEAFEDSTQREPSEFEHVLRQRQLAITASQVTNEEDITAADAFFGPLSPAERSESRGASTSRVTTRGGLRGGSRGALRPLQQPARRRGGHRCPTPTYMQDNEAMFSTFQL